MKKEENIVDIRRIMRAARQWRWAIVAVIICFTAAGVWFGMTRLSKTEIRGELLIGDNNESDASAGGMQQMMRTFSVGGFAGTGVNNELMIISSHDVMLRTVRSLDLNRVYIATDHNGKRSRLYKNSPVRVEAPAEQFDSLSSPFNLKITLKPNGKADVIATEGFFKKLLTEAKDVTFPYMLKTPYGNYQLISTEHFNKKLYKEIKVGVYGNDLAAEILYNEMDILQPEKLADVISVNYTADNVELGKAIVDAIMGEYNSKRRERLHETSEISIKYYDERIAETFNALQKAEEDEKEYQKQNELMGVDSELGLLVNDAYGSRQDIRNSHYEIAYYETVLDILRNRLNDDVIIPSIETLGDANVEAFNGMIQARRDLRRSATDENEAMIQLNKKIEELRDLIIENSTKQLAKLKKDLQHKESLAATAEGRLDKYPDYQLELLNLARNKGHLNSLYEYLVGQRENSVLQRYSTANIGFVFQPAYVVKEASVIKKLIWPFVALFVSLICCICWCILMSWCSRKVKSPIDVAFLGIENNSIVYDGNPNSLGKLRNMIMARPDLRVIYFNPLNSTDTLGHEFADSLLAIGHSVEVLSGFNNNDAVISVDTQQQIAAALQSADYVIVTVPQPENVADIVNAVDADNAALLLTLRSKKTSRKQLKRILKGQTVDKVYTIICK